MLFPSSSVSHLHLCLRHWDGLWVLTSSPSLTVLNNQIGAARMTSSPSPVHQRHCLHHWDRCQSVIFRIVNPSSSHAIAWIGLCVLISSALNPSPSVSTNQIGTVRVDLFLVASPSEYRHRFWISTVGVTSSPHSTVSSLSASWDRPCVLTVFITRPSASLSAPTDLSNGCLIAGPESSNHCPNVRVGQVGVHLDIVV